MKKKTTIAIVIAALFAIVISTPSKGALEEQIKETTSTKIVTTIKSTTTKKTTTTTTTTSTTTKKVGSGKVEKIDLSTIPEYSGKPYVVINNNVPNFSSEELSTKGYEKYSDLDSLGRTRTAIASVGEDTMPKDGEERGSISAIKPSG